jgi:SAM-dependent methyltransferase
LPKPGGLALKFKEFYEEDWSVKDSAPPEVDAILAQRKGRLARALMPVVDGRPPHQVRVLDASCAGGSFVSFFRELGLDVVGADISVNAILRARRGNPKVPFAAASAEEAMPFVDGCFDVVWFGETIAHLFDVHNALTEFNRVLKPGGKLTLTTPYHGLIKNLVVVLFEFDEHFYPDNYRIRFFNKHGLETSLTRAGFTPQLWTGVGRRWPLWKSFFVVAAKTAQPGPPPNRHPPSQQQPH